MTQCCFFGCCVCKVEQQSVKIDRSPDQSDTTERFNGMRERLYV